MKINYGKEITITNNEGKKFVGHFVGLVEYVISRTEYDYDTAYRPAFQTNKGSILAVEQTDYTRWSTWSLKPMCFLIHWGAYRYNFPEYLKSTVEFEPVANSIPFEKFVVVETDELPF